jgi:glycosyl transferase family 25
MWPVVTINLNRSPERWAKMTNLFPQENLIRIEAVDGYQWGNGTCDDKGMPLFEERKLEGLYKKGILGREALDVWPLIPAEVGCTLSHMKVWEWIMEKEVPWTVVLEDDIKPTSYTKGTLEESLKKQFVIQDDTEVIFLTGADSPWQAIEIDEDNKLLTGNGTCAYAISLEGALRAYQSMTPMCFPLDIQWFARAFESYEVKINKKILPEIPKGQAYGLSYGIVDLSSDCNNSTMTPHGKKPWKELPWNKQKKESDDNVYR